ncbi:MAG: Abortive infection protein [Anaerocolumna sp.]|jgi:membrane protease YdiL (CAAX protease family)|nr:Abortive infection protein [Anaerocolumna sp.]
MIKSYSERHPYIASILIALLCTFITALGSAVSQNIGLDEEQQITVITAFLVVSVVVGLILMKKSRFTLSEYGFRKNHIESVGKVGWFIPLVVIEILPIAFAGLSSEIKGLQYINLLFFVIAVGFNEEIYFRGLAFKFMKEKGTKNAIIGTSILFGVLHLANAFNGKDLFYVILQIIFAFLVGFVLAEIVSITKSLWVAIIWHASHDYISSITGDLLNTKELIILAVQVAVLIIYAFILWKSSKLEDKVK